MLVKKVKSYRDLEVWRKGVELAVRVCHMARHFPASERFGLVAQIQRSALSVPANIAEGWGRGSTNEFVWFLKVAKGSLHELETHLIVAHQLGYLTTQRLDELLGETETISRMLLALIRNLRKH
jgi:four helix bundle protein